VIGKECALSQFSDSEFCATQRRFQRNRNYNFSSIRKQNELSLRVHFNAEEGSHRRTSSFFSNSFDGYKF